MKEKEQEAVPLDGKRVESTSIYDDDLLLTLTYLVGRSSFEISVSLHPTRPPLPRFPRFGETEQDAKKNIRPFLVSWPVKDPEHHLVVLEAAHGKLRFVRASSLEDALSFLS